MTAGKVVLRSLSCIGTAIIYIVAAAYTLLFIVANGPSPTLRDTLVLSAMQASATKWVPGLFLSDQEVQQIVDNSYVETKLTIDKESYFENGDNASDDDENIDGMKYIIETHDGFKAYILLVKNPSRLYVGASDETYQAEKGVTVFEIAKRDDAIAAINGGEFEDKNGQGLGNIPIGLTYSNGKCVWDEGGSRTFIGIDNNNRLVVSEGMTKSKADALGIRDGVSFKYGNTLIKSDDDGVHVYYKKRNTGVAQRTAIGQRADGTFILLVTDGRSASSIGANYNDVIDIAIPFENPEDIINDIVSGIEKDNYYKITDRKLAIKSAIYTARYGDTVLVAGKGHEKYQISGTQKIYFNEREIIRKLLEDKARF